MRSAPGIDHRFRARLVRHFRAGLALAALAAMTAACGCRYPVEPVHGAAASSEQQERRGYLEPAQRPDSVKLLPPPPQAGSDARAADEAVRRALVPLQGTARWRVAATDADVSFPRAAHSFSCALGVPISREATPNLYQLMQRTLIDAGQSTLAAKDRYQAPRPFMLDGAPTCLPDSEDSLRKSPGYPSGHASAGWAWALLLAELAPDRAQAIRARGYEFGQSRVVCGVHWQSDVDAGRKVAEAVVERLRHDAEFRAQFAQAKREVAALRQRGVQPGPDECALESAALGPAAGPH